MDDLLNTAPCGFLSFTDDGAIVQANATLSQWLGYEPGELTGQSINSILSIGGRIFYQTHLFPLLKLQGMAEEVYFSLKTREGASLSVLTNAVRRERDGVFVSDCVFLPMRQRREFEDELLQAKKLAEAASEAKAKFLSTMSHELRTPMNAILGFGQLLEMDALEPSQADSVKHILHAGTHLLSLINEVLDISRIDAGQLEIAHEAVDANEVMQEAFEMARPLGIGAGLQMAMQPVEDNSAAVWADRGRLRQVLLNLLANAIKYNRKMGSVTLTCERANPHSNSSDDSIPGEERLRFMVGDTGPGIAPDKLDRLFIPFERLGAENSEVEGTGLGLALCKRLIEAMGGQIGVQSTLGEGSCFWVELPSLVNPIAHGNASVVRNGELMTMEILPPTSRLLYIEDNQANLALIQRILSHRPNLTLLTADTGESGLQLAQEHSPELILLDLQLPDMQGDKVLQHLRAGSQTRDTPVVMLSADATPGQIERLLEAGADAYLTKPIDVKHFLQVIDETLERKSARP